MTIPECACRIDLPGEPGRFFCRHPQMHAPDSIVSGELCQICQYPALPVPKDLRPVQWPDPRRRRTGPCLYLGEQTGWKDCPTCSRTVRLKLFQCRHPEHPETTLPDCERCGDYEQSLGIGGVRSWAVGVTTAARTESTIEHSWRSLVSAGWDEAQVFAEPGSLIPDGIAPERVTWRCSVLGAFGNWLLSVMELYLRHPQADAFLIAQDDALFARGTRQYLEDTLWPQPRGGVVSPYCSAPHAHSRADGYHRIEAGWNTWGAVALVFSNAALRRLLTDPAVIDHRTFGPANGDHNIDSVVGHWCLKSGQGFFVHAPSLVQHIGTTSTLYAQATLNPHRRADTFVDDVSHWCGRRVDESPRVTKSARPISVETVRQEAVSH